jgi:SAM-dependent methyltransferase
VPLDVVDLRDFYRSALGRMVRRAIDERLRSMWPDLAGQTLVGVGFATPYLRAHLDQAARVIALMPASQGVVRWPREGRNRAALFENGPLPLADRSVDRLLLVHAIEAAEPARPLLREVWRVLADDGRLIVVAPNRAGVWARLERTPFGHGRPYTTGQLKSVLREALFLPVGQAMALMFPPIRSRFLLASAPAWERWGRLAFSRVAGVVVIEAAKQVYAGLPEAAGVARRRPLVALPQGRRRETWEPSP